MDHHFQMTSCDFDILNQQFQADIWLMEYFGCEFFPGQNGWLNCVCPFEDHEDNSPSFGINNAKGIFKCFGCGKSGGYVKLVSILLKVSINDAIKLMSQSTGFDLSAIDTFEYKVQKLQTAIEEKDDKQDKINKLIAKATIKIKKIMKTDFEKAENLYRELDEIVVQNNRQMLRNFIDERIK